MADIVKIIFDGDLTPLQSKQAIAKGELNAFVTESEAEIKGIATAGAAIGTSVQKGAQDFSTYYRPVISDLSRDINSLGPAFEKVLGPAASQEARVGIDSLGASLKKLNLEGYEAAASSELYQTELRSIRKELAAYQLQLAEATQEQIFFTEAQLASGEAGKLTANFGARPLRGYGGLLRASGTGVNEVEANAALQIIGKLGIAVSSLVVVGGVAALGAAAIGVSSKLREEAEHRLETEESISGAIFKQVTGLQEANTEYEHFKEHLRDSENLATKISSLVGQNDPQSIKALQDKTDTDNRAKIVEINRLQADLASSERLLETEKARKSGTSALTELGVTTAYTPAQQRADVGAREVSIEKLKRNLADAEAALKTGEGTLGQLDKALTDIQENQNKAFDAKFTESQRVQERNRKFEEEQAAKFIQSVKEANQEITRLTKGYKDEFEKLYEGADKENPFARQMIENAKAVETLNEKLAGASPELKKTAQGLLDAANAQQAYTVQINSAFQTIDLQSQADRFRNPTQRELQNRFNDQVVEFQRTSNTTNPDVFYDFAQRQKEINETAQRQTQEKLDQKLDIAARAKTDDQKAIADKAVTSFAGALNPDDLTRSERGRIADAFERSAARNEARQEESLVIFRNLNQTWNDIKANGLRLSNIAEVGGKQELDITLKDDTSDKKATNATTATPQDVNLGYAAGPGGLTNQ